MTSSQQKAHVLQVLSKALAEKHSDPLLRVVDVRWTMSGDYTAVSLAPVRTANGMTEEYNDIVVQLGIKVPANTSCYATAVVDAVLLALSINE